MPVNVRQIGDEVLHKTPKKFQFDKDKTTDLAEQLSEMRHVLYSTGGVGVAANQCADIADPYQIIIVGNNDPISRENGHKRYPDREVPYEIVMINPQIHAYAGVPYYPGEGCLSIKTGLRGKVQRYPEITVHYFDEQGNAIDKKYENFVAHIVQHETDHLLGEVYLQKIIAELDHSQLRVLLSYIEKQLVQSSARKAAVTIKPLFVFIRDEHNRLQIDEKTLATILPDLETETLHGVKKLIVVALRS